MVQLLIVSPVAPVTLTAEPPYVWTWSMSTKFKTELLAPEPEIARPLQVPFEAVMRIRLPAAPWANKSPFALRDTYGANCTTAPGFIVSVTPLLTDAFWPT